MMLKVWRLTKWVSIGFATLILLIVATLAFAMFTNAGLNSILWGVNKALPQLQVSEAKGSLFPRFTLNQVSFVDESLHIDLNAQSLTLAVDLNCLSDPRVCINELAITGLNFSMPEVAPSEPSTEPSEPLTSISTPIPIAIGKVNFSDINLDILGTKVNWDVFSTSLAMTGSKLTVGDTLLKSPRVALAPSDETSAEPQEPQQENKPQAIELPEVLIPLFVNIAGIEIQDFKLEQDEPVIVNNLQLVGRAGEHDVHVDKLQLDMPQVDALLNGDITLNQGYPLDLFLTAHLKQTDLAGQRLQLEAKGSVEKLSLDSQFSGLITGALNGELQPLEPTLPFDATISDAKATWPLTGKSDYQVAIESLKAKGSLERV